MGGGGDGEGEGGKYAMRGGGGGDGEGKGRGSGRMRGGRLVSEMTMRSRSLGQSSRSGQRVPTVLAVHGAVDSTG